MVSAVGNGTHVRSSLETNGSTPGPQGKESPSTRSGETVDNVAWKTDLLLYVNGLRTVLHQVAPETTLLQYLRLCGLTGTKLGCGEGGCGACTVMVSSWDTAQQRPRHVSVNACLAPLAAMDHCAVTTVEGIGSIRAGVHPLQRRVAELHGSQCGFCTPGIIMAMYTLFRNNPEASADFLEENMDGNLCRCTGYRPLLDAAKTLLGPGARGAGCCRGGKGSCPCQEASDKPVPTEGAADIHVHATTEGRVKDLARYPPLERDPSTEPIFPPELALAHPQPLRFVSKHMTWYRPTTLAALLSLKAAHPEARVVAGNTEVGIETKFKQVPVPVVLAPVAVPELNVLRVTEAGVDIGGAVSLARLEHFAGQDHAGLKQREKEAFKARGLEAVHAQLRWFASNQIRNVASLAGNLATASPISDMNPVLVSLGATVTLASQARGERVVPVRSFFRGYRKVDMLEDEVIKTITLPFPASRFEFVGPYKQARRREDDISIVTACLRVRLVPVASRSAEGRWVIEEAGFGFGGMAPTTVAAQKTEAFLRGKDWAVSTIRAASQVLREDLPLPATVPGGQAEYRRTLPPSFLFKFFVKTTLELESLVAAAPPSSPLPPVPVIPAAERSAARSFLTEPKPATRGEQRFTSVRVGEGLQDYPPGAPHTPAPAEEIAKGRGAVGKPVMHKSALAQVTGEAKYTDDLPMPPPPGLLHGALVMSTKAYARLVSVDATAALAVEGVVRFISYKDVPGGNKIGAVVKDEECFATQEVHHVGAVIGIVVAETEAAAGEGARAVKVEYEELSPVITNIEEGIRHNSFFAFDHMLESGPNVEAVLAAAAGNKEGAVVVEGEMRVGGQEHFYLETNATYAIPGEDGALEVWASTQNPSKTQNFCAYVCGIPTNRVVCRMKRMGGGFGGKETRSVFISCTAALAAHLTQRPVRISLDRDVDMHITGQRHAFLARYKAAAGMDGKLLALNVELFNNGGFSLDLSGPVADRALFHVDNCYRWPSLRARGRIVRTHQASHTAFRGFGGPQGMVITEAIMDHLASALGTDPQFFREKNFYQEKERTHFGQELVRWHVPRAWEEALREGQVAARRGEIEAFNAAHRYRKRGLCAIPTKFGISFTAKFMNQGGALVHVYQDGTVLVSHGGTEMGQGLHTKVCQIAARAFGLEEEQVHIAETATDRVANSQPTAASMSTDLYGMATLDACQQILRRLAPVRARLGGEKAEWTAVVQAAYFERIDLSAHGFYIVPDDMCGYDWEKKGVTNNSERGQPFNYFTQGTAVSEVEVDCLTGDARVLRADIVMDVGASINPSIDVGQIEGAFVQGFGWLTTEELIWGDADHPWVKPGSLLTRGPGAYKIPAFNDVPIDFRVTLLKDTKNPVAVHSSKAIGEPPFFLAASAFFAIKDAVSAYRTQELGIDGFFPFYGPASTERIRMACVDDLAAASMEEGIEAAGFQAKGSW